MVWTAMVVGPRSKNARPRKSRKPRPTLSFVSCWLPIFKCAKVIPEKSATIYVRKRGHCQTKGGCSDRCGTFTPCLSRNTLIKCIGHTRFGPPFDWRCSIRGLAQSRGERLFWFDGRLMCVQVYANARSIFYQAKPCRVARSCPFTLSYLYG
jgi:hypothetical protein